MSGQVPPAIMQQFDQTLETRISEIKQRYANMGRDASTDSAAQAEIARAQQAKDKMIADYANGLVTQGLNAAGVASGPTQAAAQTAAQRDAALQASMSNTLRALAELEYLSRQQPGTVQ
jgi:hypothetical protein